MATTREAHPSVEDRRARGKGARAQSPVSGHAGWALSADRPDPVTLLEEQNVAREPDTSTTETEKHWKASSARRGPEGDPPGYRFECLEQVDDLRARPSRPERCDDRDGEPR